MENKKHINVKCYRFDPEINKDPYYDIYEVPLIGAMSVKDCLIYIRENLDPSLAFFVNCKLGFCRRCLVRVNGKSCLACITEIHDDIIVEPLLKKKIIRDLWCEGI